MKAYDVHMDTIVCDVDNVVVESGKKFATWLSDQQFYVDACDKVGVVPIVHSMMHYDPIVGLQINDSDINRIWDWWGARDLYDDVSPVDGCVEVLEHLSSGYNIVFASHTEGDHAKSKVLFLKKFFPFMSGFSATRQKNMIKSKYNIDDRAEHLTNLPISTTPLLFESTWSQPHHIIQIVNWNTISKYIKI